MHPSASAVWPPTGIALAALLLWGVRLWPAVAIAAFFVNFTATGSATTSLGIAAGNTLEAVVGAHLVRGVAGGPRAFERPQDVFKFGILAALLATMLAATVGTVVLAFGGLVTPDAVDDVWLTWWLGDAAGALIVAPVVILWVRPSGPVPSGRRREGVVLFATALLFGVGLFAGPGTVVNYRIPFEFLATPFLVWAALRFGPRETATVALLLSAVAIWGTLQNLGPFARQNVAESQLILQAFMAVVSMTALVLAADVLQRRRVEIALRSTEQRLTLAEERRRIEQALAEAQAIAHLGSWEWDVPSNRLIWSDEMYRIYGLDPNTFEATYEAYLACIHPDDRELGRRVVADAYRERRSFEYQHRVIRPDGAVRLLQARGRVILNEAGDVIRMVGTGQDVTELQQMEQEAAARAAAEASASRAARLQQVTAALSHATMPSDVIEVMVNEGIAALEADAGSIVLLSDDVSALEVVLSRGYPQEAVQPWVRIPIDAPVPLAECVRTALPVWLESPEAWADHFPQMADASQRTFAAAAAIPLLVRARAIGAMGLSFRAERRFSVDDRTLILNLAVQCALALERARLYEREQAARTAAEEALNARDEFLSVAAHELRTPITSLRLYSQHLLRRLGTGDGLEPDHIKRSLEVFDVQTVRLTRLVSQLLDVSRIEAGRLQLSTEAVDLVALVEGVVDRTRLQTGDREIRVETPAAAPADLDPLRIEQVVTNLVDNAVKYSPNPLPIEVTLRDRGPGEWELAVRDYGPGVAAEQRERIFDRFYQADVQQHNPGLGLGLYVTRQIVELHGGTLSAEFPDGGGSRFVVRLPAHQAER